ncbi:unnamed protein product [Urochloa humidicola]
MTYNVWCREDVVLFSRMKAIGRLVQLHQPDVICFQEVTPYIHKIFQSFAWWKEYHCSPVTPLDLATKQHFCLLLSKLDLKNFARWKFANSPTGRCYLEADIHPEMEVAEKTPPMIRVATAQLEPPTPPAAMLCMERYVQAEHAVAALGSAENVVFGRDMSWDDKVDLPFPLLGGWVDAYMELKPYGYSYTYDALWNRDPRRASDRSRKSLSETAITQRRSDRFVCKLKAYELKDVELIGTEGWFSSKIYKHVRLELRNDRDENVNFLPSSHFGVVLTLVPKVGEALDRQ